MGRLSSIFMNPSQARRLAVALLLCPYAFAQYRGWAVAGGGTAEGIRFSNLSQVNRTNVKDLRVAWTFDTGDAFKGSEMQCNPIVVDGVLYATTPKLRVIALDAATGRLLWSFNPFEVQKATGGFRNRGVVYAGGRVYVTARNWLYALDAKTGKPVPDFGSEGRVDMRAGLGRPLESISISATSPGVVYKDLLILGSLVSEDLPSSPGDIRAFDLKTGAQRWSFHTIPHPGEFGYDTWPKDAWQYSGGANSWPGLSLDEKRGIVYVPTGSASFDFYGANRAGDNLFANCLLALDAATGKRIWHFQTVRHDVWDRDLPAAPSLVTVTRDGRKVDAVAQPTKSGFVFVFDRETGKPLFPIEERAYPASDVDGEVLAATQPLPVAPPPFARQVLRESDLTRRTAEGHAVVLDRFRGVRSAGQFIPPSLQGTVIFPGFDGGAEWGGAAFDPQTGLLYINSNEMPWILRLVPRAPSGARVSGRSLYVRNCANCHKEDLSGSPPGFPSLQSLAQTRKDNDVMHIIRNGAGRMPAFNHLGDWSLNVIVRYVMKGEDVQGTAPLPRTSSANDLKYSTDGYNKFLDPEGYPAIERPWGTLNAIDLNRGEIRWRIPFGEFPELAAKGLRDTGSENYGGPVVTAGGLLFIAATNHDRKFRAYDKETGKLLWETLLPAAGNATPAVYEWKGRQYIVIAAGGGKSGAPSGGSYVAFTLPERRP